MGDDFRVDGIDHVALTVPDPREAAEWYDRVFGLRPVAHLDAWAEGSGPLVVSANDGETGLALFAGDPDDPELRHLAFRVDADRFLGFLDRAAEMDDVGVQGRGDIVDHDLAWSVYFDDPWEHRFEITTYEYDRIAAALS